MKKEYTEPERKLRAYKTINKKSETEDDVKDMLRLVSENLNGLRYKGNMKIEANRIENPSEIVTNPDSIAEQIITKQAVLLGDDKCRSRRVNVMTFMADKRKYKINKEDGVELARGLRDIYQDYPSVTVLTEDESNVRVDAVISNFSNTGKEERLTQVFNPYAFYNLYKKQKEQKEQSDI